MASEKQPILSICIPTYGRCEILKGNLEQIQKQLDSINMDELEFIVSNNCSPDKTEEVVLSFINRGMPIVYNCNKENLGADGNFLKCMNMAKGKYIWLLADDDYLMEGALSYIVSCLRNKDYGLLYIGSYTKKSYDFREYDDINAFFRQVGYEITFISGNIFRKDIVGKIKADKYKGSYFMQIPFFITSACEYKTNAVVGHPILSVGVNPSAPYNYFQVFFENYFSIISEFLGKYEAVSKDTIKFLKRDYLHQDRCNMIYYQLLRPNTKNDANREQNKRIVLKYYGNEPYFYWKMFLCFVDNCKRYIRNRIKK